MNDKINIVKGPYFPFHFRMLGWILTLAGLFFLFENWILGSTILPIALLIISTYQGTEIDMGKKKFQEYALVAGLKFGPRESFDNISYVFLKEINSSQTMNTRGRSLDLHGVEYTGFLKFSDGTKVEILSQKDYDSAKNKLHDFSKALKCEFKDLVPVE